MPAFPKISALFEECGCVFVACDLAAIPEEEALAALHPEERALCADMCAARRHEFAMGRLLAHAAFAELKKIGGEKGVPKRSGGTQKSRQRFLCSTDKAPCMASGRWKAFPLSVRNAGRASASDESSATPFHEPSGGTPADKKACGALLRGPNGEPLWPEGIVGSLTHTKDIAMLVCVSRERWQKAYSPGIDLERADRAISDAAWKYIAGPSEERAFEGEARAARILLFSAKESLFKALFPAVGRYIGFHEAAIAREDAAKLRAVFVRAAKSAKKGVRPALSGSFRLVLLSDLCAEPGRFSAGEEFTCHWEIDGGYALTSIIGGLIEENMSTYKVKG